ncbi:ISL3 family transposase [Actinomycetaceae bacterium MB13-C1-2]|nr:ISL3 family transposase [Actinomycetaceae bacterium MB13-C1-2]
MTLWLTGCRCSKLHLLPGGSVFEFTEPCLESAFRLDTDLVKITGQALIRLRGREVLVFETRLVEPGQWCYMCGCQGRSRGSRSRMLTHCSNGTRPVKLLVRLRCFSCDDCQRYWSEQIPQTLAPPGSKLTVAAVNWALVSVVLDGMSINTAARNLGAAWNTVNTAVLQAGYEHLISDPNRFDGVSTIGVDEHCWKHTGWRSDRFVTVIIDLTPRKDKQPARLLDMIPGRSKKVLKTWLKARDTKFRLNVKTVAMDGFTGYKTAVREVLSSAVTVMDPFHVVQLVGDKITQSRQRLQQETTGHRGHKGDQLFQARRLLLTRNRLLEGKAAAKVDKILQDTRYAALTRIWGIYQAVIGAYENPNKKQGREKIAGIIDALNYEVTKGIPELGSLARTLRRRRDDILAYFTHPYSSNGPTEAINGRLEHLRGIALGFRNLENYITRSLLHTGGFKHHLQPIL